MDIANLTVGQKVWMRSGALLKEGIVTGIFDARVEVELTMPEWFGGKPFALHFRTNSLGSVALPGDQCGVFYGGAEYDRRPLCTEFGPWELVDSIC
jgi:hypothetical protein